MQKTFNRHRQLKETSKAEPFLPGEVERKVHYLDPTHKYNNEKSSPK